MADLSDKMNQELDRLRTLRDELRVRLHLARAEARDRWERLEEDWEHLEGRLGVLRRASKDELEDVREAAGKLLEEIRSGYEHLKSLL